MSSCSDSFLTHMRTVMSDTGLRNTFTKLLDLDTLLSLIKSFLIDKRVMVYSDVSLQSHLECDMQIITLTDGKSTSFQTETATTDKLMAGSFILAAICATTGHVGFLCEASYKVLGALRLGAPSVFDCPGGYESRFLFPPCAQCPFSDGVASVDEVLSLLLDRLRGNAVTVIGNQSRADVSDVFSLVELLGHYMTWDWTRSKIIPQLLEIMESCVLEEILTAAILLIGQLGSLGIDEDRREQMGVEELRWNLVLIFNQNTMRNFRLPTQVAIVHALIGLLSTNFGNILKNEELPSNGSENVYASLVRTWFSQLTKEQKLLSVGLLQPTDGIRD